MINTLIRKLLLVAGILVAFIIFSQVFAKDEEVPMQQTEIDLPMFKGNVSWVEKTPEGKPASGNLIGIHGTPGSWTAWKPLMAEPSLSDYQFYAFDRAGWGQSQNETTLVYPSLKDQADILAAAIRPMNLKQPTIIVAHSWGGPVALALAAYHPEVVDGLLLIAAPASPKESEPRWYHKAAKAKPIQWIIGKSMSRSNIEMLALDSELEILESELTNITVPTVIMQGKKDWLVNPENAFYLKRKLENAQVKLMYDIKANHFIPFSQTEKVVEEVDWLQRQLGS